MKNPVHIESIRTMCREIYQHPELGYQEELAAASQKKVLEEAGFEVEFPFAGFPTAFRSRAGEGGVTLALMSEYDALPGLGHACGHNLIATAAMSAFLCVAAFLREKKCPGQVLLLGTPAEETYGGKVELLNLGAFKGVDAALTCHPFDRTGCDPGSIAVSRFDVTFHGRAAHAASAPGDGINALDAMVLFFSAIGSYRQQMPSGGMIHGIITQGGTAPNIIPDLTQAFFYLRADDNDKLIRLERRFREMAQGAALSTGCTVELVGREHTYCASRPNRTLSGLVNEKLLLEGFDPVPISGKISSDYANVSVVLPTVNFFFDVTSGIGVPLHSEAFAAAAGTEFAFEQSLRAGKVMADAMMDLFTCNSLLEQVKTDFLKG